MDIGAFGKGKGKQSKGKHGKGKGKQGQQGMQGMQGMQGQQGQQGQQGRQGRDKSKDSMEFWNYRKRGHLSKDCWSKNDNKGGSNGKHKNNATDAEEMGESVWIKIGVNWRTCQVWETTVCQWL